MGIIGPTLEAPRRIEPPQPLPQGVQVSANHADFWPALSAIFAEPGGSYCDWIKVRLDEAASPRDGGSGLGWIVRTRRD